VLEHACVNPKPAKHSNNNDVELNSTESVDIQWFIMSGLLTIISNDFFGFSFQKY
jgi:hypothetical protein